MPSGTLPDFKVSNVWNFTDFSVHQILKYKVKCGIISSVFHVASRETVSRDIIYSSANTIL